MEKMENKILFNSRKDFPCWQFRGIARKIFFPRQQIYVSSNKFVAHAIHRNTHTHRWTPTWADQTRANQARPGHATCLWPKQQQQQQNNENVFHFDWQFPQFLVVATAAPPCCGCHKLLKTSAQICRTDSCQLQLPFVVSFVTRGNWEIRGRGLLFVNKQQIRPNCLPF